MRYGDRCSLANASTSGREALRDVVVAEEPAHNAGVLALDEGVVGGAPRARLGEVPDVQLVEQRGHLVVDVLGAGAPLRDALSAWKPTTTNGNRPSRPSSSGTRKRSEIAATAPTNSYCVTADRVAVGSTTLTVYVHALGTVAVALVDGVDAQETGDAVRLRRPTDARHRRRLRPSDHRALRPVGPGTPQVVAVAGRDPGEALEARVAEDMVLAVQYDPGREAGHLAEVRVHLGQQARVGRRVDARDGPTLVPVPTVDHLDRLAVLANQPRELGARIARGPGQVALHSAFEGLSRAR